MTTGDRPNDPYGDGNEPPFDETQASEAGDTPEGAESVDAAETDAGADMPDAPEIGEPLQSVAAASRGNKQALDALTGKMRARRDLVKLSSIRPVLADHIRAEHPAVKPDALVSRAEIAKYRLRYVEELLRSERGELTELEKQVAESLAEHDTLSENVDADFQEHRTFADRLSDHLASFGGSWTFLISFGSVLVVWMGVSVVSGDRSFDPYPFILLNLLLSCLAAVQAPIIMMSQRRQEQKDRLRSENDYRVNLKAELEIRHLHEKMDHLLSRQWERLAEIQQLQFETIQEGLTKRRRKK